MYLAVTELFFFGLSGCFCFSDANSWM